jgi:hypothetical protein
MQRRAIIDAKWMQWGAVVLLGSVSGCALLEEDWQKAITGLEDRSGHANGGVPGGKNADAGQAMDAAESSDATASTDVGAATDVSTTSDGSPTTEADASEDAGGVCANGFPACEGVCCPDSFSCQNGNCLPACGHAYALCGGQCCPLDTFCINSACSILCTPGSSPEEVDAGTGTCSDGGICSIGAACEVVPSYPPTE